MMLCLRALLLTMVSIAAAAASNPRGMLPLLGAGPHVGVVVDSSANATVEAEVQAAFAAARAAGADLYQIGLTWASLENASGVIDVSSLTEYLDDCAAMGLAPLVHLGVVDTDILSVPADLADPGDPARLAGGMTFASQPFVARYERLLAAAVPLVVARGGFYVGFANEVDVYLASQVRTPRRAPARRAPARRAPACSLSSFSPITPSPSRRW